MENSPDREALLKKLERIAERDHVPILRGPEREILMETARKARPSRILEIGTAIGFSTLLLGISCPGASIDTVEIDEERHALAEKVMNEAGLSRVHCHLGDAGDIIPSLSGPYDFVFLDGPKGQYLRELKGIEPLLSEKAVIAADNVLFWGLVRTKAPVPHRYRTIVMRLREYIAYVGAHYDTKIYENGDGLAVSYRKSGSPDPAESEDV